MSVGKSLPTPIPSVLLAQYSAQANPTDDRRLVSVITFQQVESITSFGRYQIILLGNVA